MSNQECCPKCGSTDLTWWGGNDRWAWECNQCEATGEPKDLEKT